MQSKKGHHITLTEFNALFERTYTSLCLFANKYLENLELSKDIVQDVFVKIWEDKIQFINEDTVKSYLYTAVKNKSLDYLKSKSYKATTNMTAKKMEELETERFFLREVIIQETAVLIENAVNTLPSRCAQIIKLNSKGLTNAKIAEKLGLSINTVKTQKKIAYKRLKPILKEHLLLIAFIFQNH